jgi:hypothetical protein
MIFYLIKNNLPNFVPFFAFFKKKAKKVRFQMKSDFLIYDILEFTSQYSPL